MSGILIFIAVLIGLAILVGLWLSKRRDRESTEMRPDEPTPTQGGSRDV